MSTENKHAEETELMPCPFCGGDGLCAKGCDVSTVCEAYAKERVESSQQWYAVRWERMKEWARTEAPEAFRSQFFSILANGKRDISEPSTYTQILNTVKHELEAAKEQLTAKDAELQKLASLYRNLAAESNRWAEQSEKAEDDLTTLRAENERLTVLCTELENQVKAQGSESYLEVQKTCSAQHQKLRLEEVESRRLRGITKDAVKERNELRQQAERLREALDKWGMHPSGCISKYLGDAKWTCTCGLDAALAEKGGGE